MIARAICLAAWLCALTARAEVLTNESSPTKTAELTRAGSTIVLPGLTIHGGDHEFIEATGKVALTDGILEFIAVEPEGRDYESLLTLDCKPSALNFALLLIGCETGAAARVSMEVEWQQDGKSHRVPVEKWLLSRRTKAVPADLRWAFTGSGFAKDSVSGRQVFLADAEQAFVSLWWNPAIVINLADDFGNPYRGADQGFEVNTKAVPPKATPIKLILRKRS